MRRHHRLVGLAFLLGACAPLAAQAPPPAVKPRIVVQAMSEGGFDVAAWSANSRFIFTASGINRELLVWDAGSGAIIDRLRLPSNPSSTTEFMQLNRMALQPDGRTLRIDGAVLDPASADLRAGRAYLVDTVSRQVRMVPAAPLRPLAAGQDWSSMMTRWMTALGVVHGEMTGMSREEALRILPPMPQSPDGRWQMVRSGLAFTLRDSGGERSLPAAEKVLGGIDDADLSPDDKRLAFLSLQGADPGNALTTSLVQLFDITVGRFLAPLPLQGDYNLVRWINASQYYVLPQDDSDDPQAGAAEGVPPPALLVNAETASIVGRYPARCFMATMPDGGLVGVGLANCRSNAGKDRALARLVGGAWKILPEFTLDDGAVVRLLAANPQGDRLAVVVRAKGGDGALAVLDAQTGALIKGVELKSSISPTRLGFAPDGRRVWFAANGGMLEWEPDVAGATPDTPVVRELPVKSLVPTSFAVQGNRLLVGGAFEERIQAVDLASGTALPPIDFPGATSVGFMRTRPILWAASTSDGIKLWNSRTGQPLMTINLLPDDRFVVVGNDGRYDTNLGPDSESFRWFMPDQPFRSLAPQTLMRDYYEPRLVAKLMDCTMAGNCATVLHPVPPVAGLNRELPIVQITGVTVKQPGSAIVSVSATETRDPDSGRSSGVYGVKLLMNNREVARNPDDSAARPATLAEWRKANVSALADADGTRRWDMEVPLPSDGKPLQFAAYSFNADRVKSDTARFSWTPPPQPRRTPRAFVLTIGVNDYAESRLQLNFAVPDAQLIAERLASIPGYEMHLASLTSARLPDGSMRTVSREAVDLALAILAGFPPGPYRERLKAAGHNVDALDASTPDDIVIISFSGHGFADAAGNFALLPSGVVWPATAAAPDPDSVIDAARLTMWLRGIQARDIAFIIDACHSGAAVNTPDFKPGPMGDPGLGQLAYDKGLRILAATQADDVALENASLNHGFLTAALGEGLTPTGGPADLNRDGRIVLDEWLRYAVARLPSLNEEVRRGGGTMAARGVRLVMRAPGAAPPKSQEPSLFDFNAAPSPVVLRGRP